MYMYAYTRTYNNTEEGTKHCPHPLNMEQNTMS